MQSEAYLFFGKSTPHQQCAQCGLSRKPPQRRFQRQSGLVSVYTYTCSGWPDLFNADQDESRLFHGR